MNDTSLWYLYKTKVWLDTESVQTASVHNIMRVLRAIRGNFNYVSTPITSGKVMYEHNYNIHEVMAINILEGLKFADELADVNNLLLPSELAPTNEFKWEQDHFQALWLSVIAEKCENVYMNDGWEYSNGCTEELVHTFQLRLGIPIHQDLVFFNTKEDRDVSIERMKNIKIFDRQRKEINIDQAIEMINKAIVDIQLKGFGTQKLHRAMEFLMKTRELLK